MNAQFQSLMQEADAAAAALLAEEEAERQAKQSHTRRKGKAKAQGGGASTPGSAVPSTSGKGPSEALCILNDSHETKNALGTVPAEMAELADLKARQREKKRLKDKRKKERQNQAKLEEARDAVRAHLEGEGNGGGSALKKAIDELQCMLRRKTSTEVCKEELEGVLAAGTAKLEEMQEAERAAATNYIIHPCVVCLDNRKDTVFLPCKHVCACAECTVRLEQSQGQGFLCPVCREVVKEYVAGMFM
eukprot:gene15761-18689_t